MAAAPGVPAGTTDQPVLVGAAARELLARAADLMGRAHTVVDGQTQSARAVQHRFTALRHQMLHRELAKIPVARLKDTTDGRLRLGPLEAAGYRTVLDVLEASPTRLQQVPNVGPQTAMQAHAAARQIAAAVDDGLKIRIDLDPADPVSSALVSAVHHHDRVDRALAPVSESASRLDAELSSLITAAAPAMGRVRHFFTGSRRKADAADALSRLQHWLSWADQNDTWESLDQAARVIQLPPLSQHAVWQDRRRIRRRGSCWRRTLRRGLGRRGCSRLGKRRNQEVVLTELPELVQVDEWDGVVGFVHDEHANGHLDGCRQATE
jgi:hypothetical protein